MIELIAWTSGKSPKMLDVLEGGVSLNYQFAEAGEVMNRHGAYSNTFRLPYTKRNNLFFEHFYDVNISLLTFDPTKQTRCEIRFNTTTLIEGFLQLRGVDHKTQTYEVAVTGNTSNIFATLDAFQMSDLWSGTDYDYQVTAQNVKDSWNPANDITTGNVGAGILRIPLVDYGYRDFGGAHLYANAEGGNVYNLRHSLGNGLQPWWLKPALPLKTILDKILGEIGYTIESTFMATDDFAKVYCILNTHNLELPKRPFYGFRVGFGADVTYADAFDIDISLTQQFTNESAPNFHDVDNLITDGVFVAPMDMYAPATNLSVIVDNTNLTADGNLIFLLERDGSSYYSTWFNVPASGDLSNQPFVASVPMNADQGEVWSWMVYANIPSGGGTMTVKNDPLTFWELTSYQNTGYVWFDGSEPISIRDCLPPMSASKFLKGVVQHFNLAILESDSDPSVIKMEPLGDFIGTGTTKDWTAKLDGEKPFLIKPTSELKARKMTFTDGTDNDYANTHHVDTHGYPLGQYVMNVDDDFASGEETTDEVFGATNITVLPNQSLTGTDYPQVTIPRLYGTDDNGNVTNVTTKPKLLYDNGLKDIGDTFYMGTDNTVSFTQYLMMSPFKDTPIVFGTRSLRWIHATTSATLSPHIGSLLASGLYQDYWAKYMYDIYSPDARMVECSLVLEPEDVRAFRFNDIIVLDKTAYRIMNISGYNPYAKQSTKVTLLKLVDPDIVHLVPDDHECVNAMTSWNLNGTVNWTTPGGVVTTTATEECCESEGLYFANNMCWWQIIDDGNDGGGGVDGGDDGNGNDDGVHPSGDDGYGGGGGQGGGGTGTGEDDSPTGIGSTKSITNPSGAGVATIRNLCLQGTSTDNADVVLTAGETGSTSSGITVHPNTSVAIRLTANGVDIRGTQGNNYGIEQVIVVRNTGGTMTTTRQHTVDSWYDTGSAPTVTLSAVAQGRSTLANTLNISIRAGDSTTTVWFTAEMQIIATNIDGAQQNTNSLCMEDGTFQTTEQKLYLRTEQT